MDVNLELIWKKIDGQLTEPEQMEFDALCKNNTSFLSEYKRQLKLNKALQEMPPSIAPQSIVSNVMSTLQMENAFTTSKKTFPALKNILFGLLVLATAISLIVLFNGNNMSAPQSSTILQDYLSDIGRQFSMPSGIKNVFPYSAALFSVMGLVWLDAIYNRKQSDLMLP